MQRKRLVVGTLFVALLVGVTRVVGDYQPSPQSLAARQTAGGDISARARKVHFSSIVLDTHADTTQRLLDGKFDIGERHTDGSVDIPRMKEGGENAQFFAVWIDGKIQGPPAIKDALDQIDLIHQMVRQHSADMVFATTANEVRAAHRQGKIAALIGMEGGHMIGNDIHMIPIYAALGVRYITLSHFYNTEWSDSSTDKPAHNGLSDFGKDVVRAMNREGIMVDISHVSDKTFYDALQVSKAPIFASHSSCRAICNHVRDMSDDMVTALAAKGGVIQINYERSFIDEAYRVAFEKNLGNISRADEQFKKECGDDANCAERAQLRLTQQLVDEGKLPHVNWEEIIEHIDHVVKLVGADHVGLGSDFDGASMPNGMEDASKLPKITEALLRKGYSERDIQKILGGNMLRVMEENERVSHELKAQP
jgi:membrane dipeptidase